MIEEPSAEEPSIKEPGVEETEIEAKPAEAGYARPKIYLLPQPEDAQWTPYVFSPSFLEKVKQEFKNIHHLESGNGVLLVEVEYGTQGIYQRDDFYIAEGGIYLERAVAVNDAVVSLEMRKLMEPDFYAFTNQGLYFRQIFGYGQDFWSWLLNIPFNNPCAKGCFSIEGDDGKTVHDFMRVLLKYSQTM